VIIETLHHVLFTPSNVVLEPREWAIVHLELDQLVVIHNSVEAFQVLAPKEVDSIVDISHFALGFSPQIVRLVVRFWHVFVVYNLVSQIHLQKVVLVLQHIIATKQLQCLVYFDESHVETRGGGVTCILYLIETGSIEVVQLTDLAGCFFFE